MARKEFKVTNGKVRIWALLPEAEFRAIEALAAESGLTVSDIVRLKLKGFEPRRAA